MLFSRLSNSSSNSADCLDDNSENLKLLLKLGVEENSRDDETDDGDDGDC